MRVVCAVSLAGTFTCVGLGRSNRSLRFALVPKTRLGPTLCSFKYFTRPVSPFDPLQEAFGLLIQYDVSNESPTEDLTIALLGMERVRVQRVRPQR